MEQILNNCYYITVITIKWIIIIIVIIIITIK